jgi:hypothetical protein
MMDICFGSINYGLDSHSISSFSQSDGLIFSADLAPLNLHRIAVLPTNSSPAAVDFVYQSSDGKKLMSIKGGIRSLNSNSSELIWNEQLKIYIFHFKTNSTHYVAVLQNFERLEAEKILKALSPPMSAGLFYQIFSPNAAHAQDNCTLPNDTKKEIGRIAVSIEEQGISSLLGRCITQSYRGAKQSANSKIDYFKKLITNPMSLWSEMVDSMRALQHLALNLKSEIQAFYHSVLHLPSQLKADIACNLVGEMTADLLMGATTGALFAKAVAESLLKIRSVFNSIKLITQLDRYGINKTSQTSIIQQVLTCPR